MQVPSWGEVKPDWRAESLGWFEEESGQLVGVGLVLYRPVPKLKKYLAYLPEGPVIDWHATDLDRWLDPMLAYLKSRGAFTVKMGEGGDRRPGRAPPAGRGAHVVRTARL